MLVGLGFDTSSEVALLGIASIQAAKGTPIWIILIFPILFTAGMCLIDTIDGALMLVAYTSTSLAHDNIAVLYYSIVLSVVTCIVAVVIGVLQVLNLILHVAEPTGRFWDGVEKAGDSYDIIGGCIVAAFVVFGVLSVLFYKRWRQAFDKKRALLAGPDDGQGVETHSPIAKDSGDVDGKQPRTDDIETGFVSSAAAADSKSGGKDAIQVGYTDVGSARPDYGATSSRP